MNRDQRRRAYYNEIDPFAAEWLRELIMGLPARVGRLRGYGNAINAAQAEEFIRAYMDVYEIGRPILTAHGEG